MIFFNNNHTYARYSDDIIVFDCYDKINLHKEYIEKYLQSKNLVVNKSKTSFSLPGEVNIFLGFSYQKGIIDLSPISILKMKGKVRRLSKSFYRSIIRKKLSPELALEKFIIRLNRKLYGMDARENDLCWAHWFFPVINTSKSLSALDKFVQDRLCHALTGKHNKANYRKVPYKLLQSKGYIPLKTAYFAFKTDYHKYLELTKHTNE